MSNCAYISVSFSCVDNDEVAQLARKHERLLEGEPVRGECILYLRDLLTPA